MKPLIAVSPEALQLPARRDGRGSFCGVSYTQAVEAAGGLPLILPLTRDRQVLDGLMKHCAGLLLTGGGDISHSCYAPRLPLKERARIQDVDAVRDDMEIHLAQAAFRAGLPVLGICRGIQVMNVALGGTLRPHIPGHRNPQPDALCQLLHWEPPSRIQALLGAAPVRVNSSHHQALDRVADGFRVVARTDDGIIEAVEHITARFYWGVQFHPERLVKVAPRFRRLFEALVAAARRR